MNVFNSVFAVRPEVDPMPLDERRRIRESLFGVGHDDTARLYRARSESGAIISTAPSGTRAKDRRRQHPIVPWLRAVASVIVVAVAGAVIWTLLSDSNSEPDSVGSSSQATAVQTAEGSAPAATNSPFVRTPVTKERPLVLPRGRSETRNVEVTRPPPGAASRYVELPDGTVVWMAEFDGDAAIPEGFEYRDIGSIVVGTIEDPAPGSLPTYRLVPPCGTVTVTDAPGTTPDRPEMLSLFESMGISGDATIDAILPPGYTVIDGRKWRPAYSAQFVVTENNTARRVRLVQIPRGSLSQLGFGGRPLEPIKFAGGPAFIDSAPNDPKLVSIYWQDGPTVFNVSSTEYKRSGLKRFVKTLRPVRVDRWTERLNADVPPPAEPASTCEPQPKFGATLSP